MCACHPAVSYSFEPNGRWAAVCSATDVWRTYSFNRGRVELDAEAVTAQVRRRYRALFPGQPGRIFLDKSPAHTQRLAFLAELAPEARFIHIHRNGLEVATSALRWASVNHELVFGHVYNSWWGVDDAKWLALLASERSPDQAMIGAGLATNLQKAAYEWILSLEAVSRDRHLLGDRIIDVGYDQLIDEPDAVLKRVQGFLGLPPDEQWFSAAVALVNRSPARLKNYLQLPAPLAQRFNHIQSQYGYLGRAESI
jgi:hypothetical protein